MENITRIGETNSTKLSDNLLSAARFHSDLLEGIRALSFTLILSVVLITNALALYVIYVRRTKRPSIKFTIGLCIENSVVGGTLLIFLIILCVSEEWTRRLAWCQALSVLFITHIFLSSWLGLLISVDRFIAIRHSLRYSKWITHRSCMLLIVSATATSLGIALLQLKDWSLENYRNSLSICFITLPPASVYWKLYILLMIGLAFALPLLLNCYIYWAIYRATKSTTALARRNSFQPPTVAIHVDEKVTESTTPDFARVDFPKLDLPRQTSPRQSIRKLSGQLIVHKDNRKAAKMGCLVILIQLFVFLPFYVFIFLRAMRYAESSAYDWLVVVCLFIDCIANPIVYVLRNKSVRVILKSPCKRSKYVKSTIESNFPTTHNSVLIRLISNQTSEESVQNTH